MTNILIGMGDVLKYSAGKREDFLLSFCVPTLNRAEELQRLLLVVVPELTAETELLIKDDSLGTESEEVFKKVIAGRELNYRYYKGEKRGIDAANIFIAENARGEFVWWFGDDDELLSGAVGRVISILGENPGLAYVWLNLSVGSSGGPVAWKERNDALLKNGDEFLGRIGIDMTLLSTGIFNRKLALPALGIAKKYVGSHFASQPLIFEAVSSGKTFVVSKPYIINHPTELKKGQNLFWDGVKTMGVAYFDILMEYKNKFSRAAIRKVLGRNFGHIWRGLVIGWVRRDTEAPRRRLPELIRYWSYPEFYLAAIIFLLPKPVVKFLLGLYKKVFKNSYLQQ